MRCLRSVIFAALALGCGPSDAPDPPTAPTEEATEPSERPAGEPAVVEPTAETGTVEPVEPGTVEGGAGAGSGALPACERARACCRAYVEALPSARRPLEERGCTEMDAVLGEAGESSEDVCEAAIGGWRQSLQLTGIDVPESCR